MRYVGLLLVLLIALPAHAERIVTPGFDAAMTARVYAAALEFIPPRALKHVTTPELTLWGLHGLTALDPDLIVGEAAREVWLSRDGKELAHLKAPAGGNSVGWSALAVALTQSAWKASASVRAAGTQGVLQGFFDSMLGHLDPYSRYIGPAEAAGEEEAREGNAGVGVTLQGSGGRITVASAISDGPAALAGVRAGDRILAVDGQSVRGASASDVEDWLAGNDGSRVKLRFVGARGRRTVELTRAQVPDENVFSFRDGPGLLVRITDFNTHTAARLVLAIEQGFATSDRPAGIVLDLRGNRGGLLYQAARSADEFLSAGLVATTEGRDPAADHVFRSHRRNVAPAVPLVVLVDGRTASAAEVMAAALADRDRGVVVGSSTLGKGLVQIVTRLPDGGELLLTWSRILAPRGWPLQGLGVLPQVCTSLGETTALRQVAALGKGRRPMASALRRERTARAPVPNAEALAIRNTCPAAAGTDLDLLVARALLTHPAAYAAALLPHKTDTALAGRR